MPPLYPILLAAAIIGSGMMPLGYSIVDEVFAGFIVLGALWALRGARDEAAGVEGGGLARLHLIVFLLMVGYFELQAIRGMIVLDSLRKVRWVLFFPLVALIPLALRRLPRTHVTASTLASTILWSSLIYSVLSLLMAVIWEGLGGSRWSLQGTWWVPTAYAALPIVIAMPYVTYGLNQGGRLRLWAWAVLAILIVSAFYFDSRIATLSILAFLVAGFSTYRWRGIAVVAGLMVMAMMLIAPFLPPGRRLTDAVRKEAGELVKTFVPFIKPPEQFVLKRDMERYIHVQVASAALRKDWRSAVFGYGYRTHGRVISPELKVLYERYGAPEIAARIREDESTIGFTALVVDTGLLGLGLFAAAHGLAAARVWAGGNRRYRLPALLAVVLLFFWQFAVNTLDAVLVYMLLMPGGPLQLLAESGVPAAAAG
ncbi:MAG TPA: hypothetical protein VFW08_07845 [bacterium]|nr:hypothetical protein [bacterium]